MEIDSNGSNTITETINLNYSQAEELKKTMNKYVHLGIPGIGMAVYTPQEGFWTAADGFASIEKQVMMQPYHLQYSQKCSKNIYGNSYIKTV